MANEPLIAAISAMDRAAEAIRSGAITEFESRFAAIETALRRLPPHIPPPQVEALRQRADRNARLLKAAQAGLKAAQRRLAELNGQTSLSTYDAKGRLAPIAGRGATDHRA